MSVQILVNNFLKEISRFHHVEIMPSQSNQNRKNVYVSPEFNKRWIQVDLNKTYLAISMDHLEGELALSDVLLTGFSEIRKRGNNSFKVTPNSNSFGAVHFSIYQDTPYDFSSQEFKTFLEKHYSAFLKRVGLKYK